MPAMMLHAEDAVLQYYTDKILVLALLERGHSAQIRNMSI
jgi:hypothetical protein